ncbi:DUF342 domain-containing protein [Clostridium sp. DJ247]|uniref:DUF342 domain-containing protein n=1 Tax=Clostridium sp. DJ247 TaxID=2726188 RepID=UPI001628EB61|nr:flagellar assembly protein A [Clostridium sp. DJ247]MBC2581610.1 DUF342 domain-containing protein [Clostridium sp. DJ247]
MKKIYSESSLEKCLKKASGEFNILPKDLEYKVLEEKKSLFRKKVTIEVEITDDDTTKQTVNNISNSNQGTIKVEDGKISIKNPEKGDEPASIVVGTNIKVMIDGKEVTGKKQVLEENIIEVYFHEEAPSREMKLSISKDQMEAYVEIVYKAKSIYKLKDKEESNSVVLEPEIVSKIEPPKYNIEEIKRELTNNNIVYGIIEENFKKCVENSSEKILIAKGKPVVNGEDDTIEIKFKTDDELSKLIEDSVGNIDFKSIGSIEPIHKGETIAIRHIGTDGQDGCDITGKAKKHKLGKRLKLKIGEGCTIHNENIILASIDGKPCVKSNTFYVYQIHEVRSDVDIKTGNIKFIGDIIVHGSIREGMEIECGNFLTVEKDVERANIKAKGDINVKGNVIAASICGGGEDVEKLKFLDNLKDLKQMLINLEETVSEIQKFNLLGQDKKDGEIIKVLIENKFKMLPKLCLNILDDLSIQNNNFSEENLLLLIKSKLLGISPISIKHYSELDLIIEAVTEKISVLETTLSLPVNVKLEYCQDSSIQSSGNIIIKGRGEYISKIIANGSIKFTEKNSVARGGILKAKDEIRCSVVGSTAGVATKLQVEKHGHIWVDTAYANTVFIIGAREVILESPSKDIHAYINDEDDIVIDKFSI